MLLLLLPQGKAGDAWEHSTKAMLFRIWTELDRKSTFILFIPEWVAEKKILG